MKNTINRNEALKELNKCFKESKTYNEAVIKFFEFPEEEITIKRSPLFPKSSSCREKILS